MRATAITGHASQVGVISQSRRWLVTWIVGADLAVALMASTMLTPLYLIYKETFHFSEVTLTLIYSTYVLGNLLALFAFGRLSDQVGRRITAWAALVVAAASTVLFAFAQGTLWLYIARLVSGFSTGLASGVATAWIAELHPKKDKHESAAFAVTANLIGIAVGPLLAGLLAERFNFPFHPIYFLYLGVVAVVVFSIAYVPETIEDPVRTWAEVSLRLRLGVPEDIRAMFLAPAVTAFGIFSLCGFYSALVPGLLAQDLHQTSPSASGTVVFGMFIVAALTAMITRKMKSQAAMLWGLGILLPSLGFLLWAQVAHSMALLIVATATSGISAGLGYCGSLQVVNQIAPDDRRSEVVSSYLIACYSGNSIPVVGIGSLSEVTTSMNAHVIFACVVGTFAVIGLITGVKYTPR